MQAAQPHVWTNRHGLWLKDCRQAHRLVGLGYLAKDLSVTLDYRYVFSVDLSCHSLINGHYRFPLFDKQQLIILSLFALYHKTRVYLSGFRLYRLC